MPSFRNSSEEKPFVELLSNRLMHQVRKVLRIVEVLRSLIQDIEYGQADKSFGAFRRTKQ
ncbi:MAG: hypothetical protein KUG75_14690 [Pseudomonadales bacterium]|nr:hypothetical protein [Pseudomonadales bacterium]